MKYRKEIDGLRAIAVLPVVLFHAGFESFGGGFVGVDVFFVISGYLITTLILEARLKRQFSFLHFYERRVRRILPGLLTVILLVTPFSLWIMTPSQLVDFSESIISSIFFFSNFHFFLEEGYFSAVSELKPLLHTWSLAIEEQFYLLFPMAFVVLLGVGKKTAIFSIISVAVLSLIFAQWSGNLIASPPYIENDFKWFDQSFMASYYMPFGRVWELLAGALLACTSKDTHKVHRAVCEFGAFLGLTLISLSVFLFDKATPFPSVYTLIPVLGTILILKYGRSTTFTGRFLSLSGIVFIGLISYSLYLFHQPVLAVVRLVNPEILEDWRLFAILMFIAGLSYFSWRFIETPFRSDTRISSRNLQLVLSGVIVVMCGFVFATKYTNGFIQRFSEDDRALLSINETEMARYTPQQFMSHRLAAFSEEKRKVFLIGDSFAMDFLNMGYAGGYWNTVSVSTHHIERQCGIVLTERNYSHHISDADTVYCNRRGRFESEQVRSLIQQADVVILASRWSFWVAEYLPDTISGLEMLGAKRIIIVGSKNIGKVNPMTFLGSSLREKKQAVARPDPNEIAVIRQMNNLGEAYHYISLQDHICPSYSECRVFTDNGELLSFDGKHLTTQGAEYFSNVVFSNPALTFLQ